LRESHTESVEASQLRPIVPRWESKDAEPAEHLEPTRLLRAWVVQAAGTAAC